MKENTQLRQKNIELEIRKDVAEVTLKYPRLDDHVKALEVVLEDVRAADSIRIEYDFERDGWSIRQASTFSWPVTDSVCDPDWQEVAFIKAWARDKNPEDSA